MNFHFKHVEESQRDLVHAWLISPQAKPWFYGQGLQNTFDHLEDFFQGKVTATYWIAYDNSHPFAFLITSYVLKPDDDYSKWCVSKEETITLDILIGDASYLGKGLAVPLITQFLQSEFPHIDEVLIDPEATNLKAIHVYKKAGFVEIGTFIPKHSPHPHLMMRMNR